MENKESFLDREHSELLESLQELSSSGGCNSRIFSDILKTFSYHLDREEETVVPLLGYLKCRIDRSCKPDVGKLRSAWDDFTKLHDTMLEEHREIKELLSEVKNQPETSLKEQRLIRTLEHHVEIEEEILYPASMAAGVLTTVDKRVF